MRRASALLLAGLALGGAIAGCDQDPVHDQEVAALGPEAPGVSPGATHRPGQPCLVCHGGSGPANLQFAVAGTVYQAQSGAVVPQIGATVSVVDTNGAQASAGTNGAGNFWVLESQWSPTFPVHVLSVAYADLTNPMFTHIGRDGSCASCHCDPPGGDRVGHIYLAPGDEPDGGYPDGGP